MTGSDHLIQATPELLEGWQGPIVVDGEPMVLLGKSPEQWEHMPLWDVSRPKSGMFGFGSMLCRDISLDLLRPEVQALLLREVVVAMGLRPHLGCCFEITLDRSRLGDSVRCVTVYGDGEGTVWPAPEICPYVFEDAMFAPGLLDLDASLPEEELGPLVVRALWEALCQPTDASAHQEGER